MKIWANVIIGAGVSGLVLARRLLDRGQDVLILEKSKSVGGRMATRRDDDASFDHGAQFSLTNISGYSSAGTWTPWVSKEGAICYAVNSGINKAAKDLSRGLNVQLNQKVVGIKDEKNIYLNLEDGSTVTAERVFISAPVPQALELLRAGNLSFAEELNDIEYTKALVGLFRVESRHSNVLGFNCGEDLSRGIYSVCNQQSKSVSETLAFTVAMNPRFSESYFNNNDSGTLFLIENCFVSYLTATLNIAESDFQIIRAQLKKWKYSLPVNFMATAFYKLPESNVFLFGDGFAGPSISGAVSSALAVPI